MRSLMTIPGEIRNQIYENVLLTPGRNVCMLRVCRAIYAEANKLFYAGMTLYLKEHIKLSDEDHCYTVGKMKNWRVPGGKYYSDDTKRLFDYDWMDPMPVWLWPLNTPTQLRDMGRSNVSMIRKIELALHGDWPSSHLPIVLAKIFVQHLPALEELTWASNDEFGDSVSAWRLPPRQISPQLWYLRPSIAILAFLAERLSEEVRTLKAVRFRNCGAILSAIGNVIAETKRTRVRLHPMTIDATYMMHGLKSGENELYPVQLMIRPSVEREGYVFLPSWVLVQGPSSDTKGFGEHVDTPDWLCKGWEVVYLAKEGGVHWYMIRYMS